MQEEIMISIIVPLFNESARVDLMKKGLKEFADKCSFSFEFILVNDASTDDTLVKLYQVKELFASTYKQSIVDVVDLKKNMRKGGALQAGVAKAKGKWVLTLDADMAVSPGWVLIWNENGWISLDDFTQNMVFIGSREDKESNVSDKFYRRLMGRCFNLFVRLLIGLNLNDTQCGFKLYPAAMAKACFSELIDLGWTHDVEILKRAMLKGASIKTLPIAWTAVDNSKINPIKDALVMFLSLFKMRSYLNE